MSEVNELNQIVVLQSKYVKLLGGYYPAAVMLCHLLYWYMPDKNGKTKLRVRKGNKLFISKSWRGWQTETGLSRSQTRTSLDKLQRFGLIEVELYKFAGTPTIHVRFPWVPTGTTLKQAPTAIELQKIMSSTNGGQSPIGANDHSIDSPSPVECMPITSPLATDSQSITDTTAEITAESKQKKEAASPPDSSPTGMGKKEKEIGEEEKKEKEGEEKSTGTEKEQIKSGASFTGTCSRAVVLGKLWKTRRDELKPGKYHAPLTKGELEKLGNLLNYLDQSGLEDKAEAIIELVLTGWTGFGQRARKEKEGWGDPPDEPQISFLLSHHSTAVNMLLEKLASAAKQAAYKLELAKKQAEAENVKKTKELGRPPAFPEAAPPITFDFPQKGKKTSLEAFEKIVAELG